jgi:hypothetical protein
VSVPGCGRPWPGSKEERTASRAREAEERRRRERVEATLRAADFAAAEAAGYDPAGVRELAQRNAESLGDLDELARQPLRRSLTRVEWESTAAHYAYWLAADACAARRPPAR